MASRAQRSHAGTPEAPKEVETPGVTTIEALAEFLGIDARRHRRRCPWSSRTARSFWGSYAATTACPSRRCWVCSGATFARRRMRRSAPLSEPEAARSARSASTVEVVADDALREGQFVAGANRDGWHLLGVEAGRDFEPRFADIREPVEGDTCPECGGALRFQTAIEVGHIFKFGSRYSEPLDATFARRGRGREAADRGQLRHRAGPGHGGRVEQSHDENGIVWPASIAPYDVHVLALHGGAQRGARRCRDRRRVARRGRAPRSSSTTATSARARSSPTRILSAARSA